MLLTVLKLLLEDQQGVHRRVYYEEGLQWEGIRHAWGFLQGSEVGGEFLLRWVLLTGLGGAIGCIAAAGHPLSVLAAFLISPITPFHPALSSGMVSAWVEAWLRRPTVADFSRLRDDVGTLGGWWRNRVSRVFVNFFLTNLGTVVGVYLAGWGMLKRVL